MKILILWSSLADYTAASFRKLAQMPDVEIHLICQQTQSEAPFGNFDLSFCKTVQIDNPKERHLLEKICDQINPDCIIMASWNYPQYMKTAKRLKKQGCYVLSAFDGQWGNTFKQMLGILISPFFLKSCIDNFLVPGDRQAQFARRLGYKNPLNGFYCANTQSLNRIHENYLQNKFLFVGRLIDQKGVDILLQAYALYRKQTLNPWSLVMAGTGPLIEKCKKQEGVIVKGFVQPFELAETFAQSSCLILPSTYEPWGVVIHEAAISGLIIIASHEVGATTWFVRDGLNGKIISPDIESIKESMLWVSNCEKRKLQEMSDSSRVLGGLWTTDKWAEYIHTSLVQGMKNK